MAPIHWWEVPRQIPEVSPGAGFAGWSRPPTRSYQRNLPAVILEEWKPKCQWNCEGQDLEERISQRADDRFCESKDHEENQPREEHFHVQPEIVRVTCLQ